MFHYSAGKKSGQDKNKNSAKFLDPKKDIHTRLKALQRLQEVQVETEVKQFFQDYSTEIFYLFYEEFTYLELNAKSKAAKLKDELEELLSLLEKIFIYLADLIHSLWQFNCIGVVLRKLLHHGNILAVREQGIKLFMLWLLILQDKVDELNLTVFASIVPAFPSPIDKINVNEAGRPVEVLEYVISCISGQGTGQGASLDSEDEWCFAEGGNEICPPQQGDKITVPEDLMKKFLDQLLYYMTSHMLEIQWKDTHMRESGFYHIFSHLKRFYLPEIFPLWDPVDRLYDHGNDIICVPITGYPDKENEDCEQFAQFHSIKLHCQSSVLGWLIKFTANWINKPKVCKFSELPGISIAPEETDGKEAQVDVATVDEEKLAEITPIVQYVLYATKENVLLVHEVFRQAFLMPLTCSDIMVHVLNVYKEWFFKVSERPMFMLEPKPIQAEFEVEGSESPCPRRSPSYKEATDVDDAKHFFSNVPVEHVCAGFHANLRLFISLSGQVFFVPQQKDMLPKHADICKKVMKHYRNIVLDKPLDALTWRQLLIVLLKIIDYIFMPKPPSQRNTTLGGLLSSYLLQTLFVTWVRASLEVYLTLDLWDELLRVGSFFTCWEEMIKEWAGTMETLTRVMARTVYGIDLNDPPLSQLTQRGNLRRIKKKSNNNTNTAMGNIRRSLSSGWTQFQEPVTEIMPNINESGEVPERSRPLPSSSDTATLEFKQHPSVLQNKSSINVKNASESTRKRKGGFADEFVSSLTEREGSNDFANIRFESRPAVIGCDTPQENFADFTAHFPEIKNSAVDSGSEFSDSELGSTTDDIGKSHFYEVLNDDVSVSSSINIPFTYNLVTMDRLLSESSQNLLGEEGSDYSDQNRSSEGESCSVIQLSAEDGSEVISSAQCDISAKKIYNEGHNFDITENNFFDILKGNDFFSSDDNFCNEEVFNSSEDFSNAEENSVSNENNYDTADEEKLDSDITESGKYTNIYSEPNCESELLKSGTYSDSTYNSNEHTKSNEFLTPDQFLSPCHLSGQDLINFESELKDAAQLNADNQSIDSHMFTSLIDNESFSVINPLSGASGNDITVGEAPVAEQDMEILEESIRNVHFEGTSTNDPEHYCKKIHIMRSESFKSPDSSSIRSVIEGGTEVGWTTVSSVILWNRVLGILGNVNDIKDQEMHGLVFKNLTELWQMLETIKSNLGISMDNKSTPLPAALTPPLYFCSTWCLQAMGGDTSSHKQGRECAFRLTCMMMIRKHGLKPSPELMTNFFRLLHVGLTGQDQDVTNAIIAESALFHTREFEGSSCLFLDFIHATNTVISTQYMAYPRKEAISLLGSMICLAGAYPNIKIYQPGIRANETQHAITGKDLREKILIPVLKAAKNDPSCRARCVAVNCLGLFIVESLMHWEGEQRIYECLAIIISSLEFHSRTVCAVALDVLVTLTYYHKELAAFDSDLPLKIVEAMCHITERLHLSRQTSACEFKPDEAPEYISKLLLCLLDWLMIIPQANLLKYCTDGEHTYIGMAIDTFKVCREQNEWLHLAKKHPLNINQIFVGDAPPIYLARVHHDLSMDDMHGITDDVDDTDDFQTGQSGIHDSLLPLTAKYCINEISNYYQYFPFDTGAVQPVSAVVEADDHTEDVASNLLDCHNVQFLLLNGTTLISVIELPQMEEFHESFQGVKTISRFIIRDISGKFCWDVAGLVNINNKFDLLDKDRKVPKRASVDRKHSRNLSVSVPRLTTGCSTELPTWETVDPNVDRVDQLLCYIGHASPECLLYSDHQLNIPAPVPDVIDLKTQSAVVTAVLKQHNEEENYVHEISHDTRISASEITCPEFHDPSSPFHYSRLLLHQFNYFSWENRQEIELLQRNEKLLRDIKNLDKRPNRETQKIAVFYVGPGQEDKHSILSNSQGSKQFEEFVAGLGWEVDLETHTGFMGGLEKNLSTGPSAPYFATHSIEVIFHVSTRMPGSEDEELKTKLRHLGNDEIHIVWSEHHRDFRRGIINTEFGDVLIVIYPMKNNLYRIHIDRVLKIPPFGPLYDGVIVDGDLLPRLVRSAAINAGRMKRATLPFFNRHYEERARCIREIAQSRVYPSTFEDFTTHVFSPCLPAANDEDINPSDSSMLRTFSVPSRVDVMKDPFSVLKILDIPDKSFRERSSTAVGSKHGKTPSLDGGTKF